MSFLVNRICGICKANFTKQIGAWVAEPVVIVKKINFRCHFCGMTGRRGKVELGI